jgi:hypothetical protein
MELIRRLWRWLCDEVREATSEESINDHIW